MTNLVVNRNMKSKENFTHNQFHNIWSLFVVLPIFFSSQMKRWVTVTYENGIKKLPHELPNNLKLRILGT